jgi:ADP-dependent NAD(P)H-hydrate dehydratase / NAD(P)H-hydrate epimerase
LTGLRTASYRDVAMEILTGRQMRRVDARAIRERGIPSLDLMEAAGRGVAAAMMSEFPELASRQVVVLCGKGNNGGDGLVAARHLALAGVSPRVILLARGPDLAGDAATNLARARTAGLPVEEIADEASWSKAAVRPGPGAVVVDAILGTGVQGGARGLAATVIEAVRELAATIVAIDLPSGADADAGSLPGPAVRAHRTYTLCRPKLALVLEPAASHAGPWRVIDIGIPDDVVEAEAAELEWLDDSAVLRLAPPRPRDAHKGTMGHLLVVAGSRGKSGAATIAARAALRSGTGLVTVAVPRSVQAIIASSQAEVMTEPLPETRNGALARSAAAVALRLLAARDALALGPGLGVDAETRAAVLAIVSKRTLPCVLDADGLNAFAADRRSRARLAAGESMLILTPHPGEAARLLESTAAAIQADRLGSARRLAAATGATVVLKGRRTVVARPDGRSAFVASGNPGMATGGTGDALTGVIGALLARGLPGFDAARLGTYVHGAAGDLAAERHGEDGLIAGDLVDALPDAWRAIVARDRGVERWTRGG